MKSNIVLHSASIKEMMIFSFLMFTVLNGFAFFLAQFILKISYSELFSKTWIILVFIPLLHGIMQPFVNKTGSLTINSDEYNRCFNIIETNLINKAYSKIETSGNITMYKFNSVFRMLVNAHIGLVKISNENGILTITSKRILLLKIETLIRKYSNH